MKLLAIDPGSRNVGLAFLEDRELVDARLLHGPGRDAARRLRVIARELLALARLSPEWMPELIAIEGVALHMNAATLALMAETRGYLARVLDVAYPGVRRLTVNPQAKRSITGGKPDREEQKKRARNLVRDMYHWELSEDECDAVVLGLAALRELDLERAGVKRARRPRGRVARETKAADPQLRLGEGGDHKGERKVVMS